MASEFQELRELVEKWRSKQNNVWDTLTVESCADELAALLTSAHEGDAPAKRRIECDDRTETLRVWVER